MHLEYTTSAAPEDLYKREIPAGMLSVEQARYLVQVLTEEIIGTGLAEEMTIELYDDSGERLDSLKATVKGASEHTCADCMRAVDSLDPCTHCGSVRTVLNSTIKRVIQ